jgi:hypothetical protein
MIRLAQYLNRDSVSLERLLQRIRALAVWASLGFVLLIPLQAAAGMRQLRSGEAQVRQRLQQVSKATDAIEKASTAAELRAAILQVPGIQAPQLPATFPQPIDQVRSRLLERLRPRLKAVETRLQNQMRQAWQQWVKDTARDSLMAGFLAIGFAALGRPSASKPPLLWSVIHMRRRFDQIQKNRNQKASASRVIHKGWLEGIEENDKPSKSE